MVCMNDQKSLNQKKQNFVSWIHFLDQVEFVFKQNGYQKVVTPYLVKSGAMEAQLDTFQTQFNCGQKVVDFDLPTSPEFSLKKALSAGFGDLFEIKTCFRNEEFSSHHRPEFTMLEFYKTDIQLNDFIDLVLKLLQELTENIKQNDSLVKNSFLSFSDFPKVEILKIADLFLKYDLELTPKTTIDEMRINANRVGVECHPSDTWDDIFFRIWIEKIESEFNPKNLTVVYNYPPSQTALARINSDGWADRFELYWNGFELGNAFHESLDPKAIEARWLEENLKRRTQNKNPHSIDFEFLKSLAQLPQCCGIAIGLERLFMAYTGLKDIGEFKFFD